MTTPRGPSWTMADAAQHYGVHLATIRRLIQTGKLPAYRLGYRTVRLDPEEVAAAFRVKKP